jgi:hypothetical protein
MDSIAYDEIFKNYPSPYQILVACRFENLDYFAVRWLTEPLRRPFNTDEQIHTKAKRHLKTEKVNF